MSRKIGSLRPFLERNERTSTSTDEEAFVQSADVFPAGRGLESLLVRETDAVTGGVAALFKATDARFDEAFERISSLEHRLQQLESVKPAAPAHDVPYVVFLATPTGYRLASMLGRLPAAGEQVGENDDAAEVLRVGASPLPGDRRPCVFAVATTLLSPDAGEAHGALARRAA